jgi:sulfur carrier protein ThiS
MQVEVVREEKIKKYWVRSSSKGTKLYFEPALVSYINSTAVEIAEENGDIVVKPSKDGIKLKLWIQRRWDGLPTCYYIDVPEEYREKIRGLRKPYAVLVDGKVVIREKTEEEELREEYKNTIWRFFKIIDDIHYFNEERLKAEEIGLPHATIDFNLEFCQIALFSTVVKNLSEFLDEIDPEAM